MLSHTQQIGGHKVFFVDISKANLKALCILEQFDTKLDRLAQYRQAQFRSKQNNTEKRAQEKKRNKMSLCH